MSLAQDLTYSMHSVDSFINKNDPTREREWITSLPNNNNNNNYTIYEDFTFIHLIPACLCICTSIHTHTDLLCLNIVLDTGNI